MEMIVVGDITMRANHAVAPEFDPLRSVKHCATVPIPAAANHDPMVGLPWRCSEQNYALVQRRAIADPNIPWITWHADTPNPAAGTDVRAQYSQPHDAKSHGHCTWIANSPI